ncbi:MAG: hypothetical protein MUE46_00930 [Xanthomonadales bacterium]|jgi:hypothetical protein|nr:hypothetical protein [Xanthomonadales bacterium]
MSPDNAPPLFWIVAGTLGAAGGYAYFRMLQQSVDRLIAGGSLWQLGLAAILRVGVALLLFGSLAKIGALPLLAGLGGFLLARLLHTRRVLPKPEDAPP